MNIWKFREKPWNKTILLKCHVFKVWYWVQDHVPTNVFRGISNVFELSYKNSTELVFDASVIESMANKMHF